MLAIQLAEENFNIHTQIFFFKKGQSINQYLLLSSLAF